MGTADTSRELLERTTTDHCTIPKSEGIDFLMPKVLSIGDSETVISRYCVGADVFEQSYFNDNGRYLREALHGQPEIELRHIIPANVPREFPTTDDELAAYDVVIFSDVGYNSMIFYPGLTPPYSYPLGPDRCQMVADFVEREGDPASPGSP